MKKFCWIKVGKRTRQFFRLIIIINKCCEDKLERIKFSNDLELVLNAILKESVVF